MHYNHSIVVPQMENTLLCLLRDRCLLFLQAPTTLFLHCPNHPHGINWVMVLSVVQVALICTGTLHHSLVVLLLSSMKSNFFTKYGNPWISSTAQQKFPTLHRMLQCVLIIPLTHGLQPLVDFQMLMAQHINYAAQIKSTPSVKKVKILMSKQQKDYAPGLMWAGARS